MQLLRSSLALAGLSVAIAITGPTPLQMDVYGGDTRCLGDAVRVGEETRFFFRAVPSTGTRTDNVQVIVEQPNGEKPYVASLTTTENEYVVNIDKGKGSGRYSVCFKNLQPSGSRARVELAEATVQPELGPRDQVAQHLRPVDELLFHAKELAESLRDQLKESAMSEREAIESDKVLRSRINKVAGFTIIILLSVSGWQLALLNRFFRSKKLI